MAVSEDFDTRIRQQLSELLRAARHHILLSAEHQESGWHPREGSEAQSEPGIDLDLWHIVVALSDEGVDLPLTVARALLSEAADQLAGLADLQVAEHYLRFASTGPLARASAERSFTVCWIFSASTRQERVARSLIFELSGMDRLLAYPNATADRDTEPLRRTKEALVNAATSIFGETPVVFDKRGNVLEVFGERLPSRNALFKASYTSDPLAGAGSYGELSVLTHPTGHARAESAERWLVQSRQIVYVPRSSVHDEGRLLEPAVLGLALGGARVGAYLGLETRLAEWAESIADTWVMWCRENGCRDPDR